MSGERQDLYPTPDFYYQNPRSHVIWLLGKEVLGYTFSVLDSRNQEDAYPAMEHLKKLSDALDYLGIQPYMHLHLSINTPPDKWWRSTDPVMVAEQIAGKLMARIKNGIPVRESEVRIAWSEFVIDQQNVQETLLKAMTDQLPTELQNWIEVASSSLLDAKGLGFRGKYIEDLTKAHNNK